MPGVTRTQTLVAFEVFSKHDLEALFDVGNTRTGARCLSGSRGRRSGPSSGPRCRSCSGRGCGGSGAWGRSSSALAALVVVVALIAVGRGGGDGAKVLVVRGPVTFNLKYDPVRLERATPAGGCFAAAAHDRVRPRPGELHRPADHAAAVHRRSGGDRADRRERPDRADAPRRPRLHPALGGTDADQPAARLPDPVPDPRGRTARVRAPDAALPGRAGRARGRGHHARLGALADDPERRRGRLQRPAQAALSLVPVRGGAAREA